MRVMPEGSFQVKLKSVRAESKFGPVIVKLTMPVSKKNSVSVAKLAPKRAGSRLAENEADGLTQPPGVVSKR